MARRSGPRRFNFTEQDLAEMERLYTEELLSTGEIAERFDCLMGSVHRRLVKRGVPMRPYNYRRPRKTRHSHGYALIGGKYEHRMVAEQKLGRKLRPGEVVHHRNGVRDDNRPENLEVHQSHSAHMQEHRAERTTWTAEGDAVLRACRDADVAVSRIACLLGCSKVRVFNRIKRLGIQKYGRGNGGCGRGVVPPQTLTLLAQMPEADKAAVESEMQRHHDEYHAGVQTFAAVHGSVDEQNEIVQQRWREHLERRAA